MAFKIKGIPEEYDDLMRRMKFMPGDILLDIIRNECRSLNLPIYDIEWRDNTHYNWYPLTIHDRVAAYKDSSLYGLIVPIKHVKAARLLHALLENINHYYFSYQLVYGIFIGHVTDEPHYFIAIRVFNISILKTFVVFGRWEECGYGIQSKEEKDAGTEQKKSTGMYR